MTFTLGWKVLSCEKEVKSSDSLITLKTPSEDQPFEGLMIRGYVIGDERVPSCLRRSSVSVTSRVSRVELPKRVRVAYLSWAIARDSLGEVGRLSSMATLAAVSK